MATPGSIGADSIEQYLLMLTVVEGRSTLTISSYESDLYALLEYLGGEDELLSVSSSKLDEYFAYLRSIGRKGSTVARAMSSARGYFRYLLDEGRLSVDPTARLAVATRGKSLPKALSEEYVNTLLASIDSTSALDIRDRLIVEFLYGTGARVSEMIDLEIQDVDLDEMLVRVTGKGSKQRLVPVGRHLALAFQDYFGPHGRDLLRSPASRASLFVNARGGKLTRHGVNEILIRRARKSGLSTNGLHAHAFRHSCATHMIAHGADIRVVQELLGHSSIATTQRYTGVALTTLRAAYGNAHPRAAGMN